MLRQQLWHCGRAHISWQRGRGFKSSQVLGFFLFSFCFCLCLSLYHWCVLKQVPHRGATQLIIPQKIIYAQLCNLRRSKLNTHRLRKKTFWVLDSNPVFSFLILGRDHSTTGESEGPSGRQTDAGSSSPFLCGAGARNSQVGKMTFGKVAVS